ncbi:relaxase/mobilization nuclease domain-containing protein [Sphaerospermopsis aphanizomenoides BCCUSP55]|uniref:relaxase/mobilization nuclease domain-containing protein n=1 Tax=Sphaerospermopsis aphanizomenoides TaxID=459663 RepID=UPI000A542C62|nr:relaxase/mobilization nuclease domain-containing protein [Sphaerospermopsis aphanizomenoides]MBK1988496.1 relaxase/mobilization nuclease domain-containing protein [Sphaerospermopsis aphanizomenoides BCCUSP55]
MIGKHIKGKSFRGLLNYLFSKEGARQIGGNMEGTNPRELAAEFGISRRLNPKVSRAVYHASLSLPHHESLDDDTWDEIAQKYLQAMGFTMNQYIVVRHTDRTHDHAHIAASRIQLDGTTVSDRWDNPRSEIIIRKLEKEYNLQSVQPSWEKDKHSPTTGERRQLARTGEESVRVKLQRSLDEATHDRPTMPELIERAQKQGINVCVGYTRTGKVKGISYQLDGVAFSGTHLGKAYTFPGLQKHRGVSYIPKQDDKRIQELMKRNIENTTSNQEKHDNKHTQKITKQTTVNAAFTKTQQDEQQIKPDKNVTNNIALISLQEDNNRLQIGQTTETPISVVSQKHNKNRIQNQQTVDPSTSAVETEQDIELIQKLLDPPVKNIASTVKARKDDQDIQKLIRQPVENITPTLKVARDDQDIENITERIAENVTPSATQTNYLPTPKPANWKQIRQNLNQQYNLPVSLLNELYQKGWLYPSQTGQPIFVERTLDDVPTLAKQLEPTGDFTAIPLNSETTKNGSFWIATDTTVTRAVLLSDPIEVLSVIALESTIDKRKRQPTLYWSIGDGETPAFSDRADRTAEGDSYKEICDRAQIPLDFLDSLDTVVIAFKDHEKVEDLISDLLTELPQAKRVSPGQAGWNQLLTDRKQPVTKHQFTQTLDWEL